MNDDLPLVYEGNQVNLRPLSRQDARTFYDWRADLEASRLVSTPEGVSGFEEYLPHWEATTRRTITLLVVRTDDGRPAGFVQAYEVNPQDGWCFLLVYQTPESRGLRMGIEAALAFWDYLFRQVNLRKIYMDVAEFNLGWLRALPAVEIGVFTEEGRFRGHVWHDGRYWDTVRLALYRDPYLELRDWFYSFLTLGHPPHGAPTRLDTVLATQADEAWPAHGRGTAGSLAVRSKIVKSFLRFERRLEIDQLMQLIADDFVYKGPTTMARDGIGKRGFANDVRFRHRMRKRSSATDAALSPIAWQPPEQRGAAVLVRGVGTSGAVTLAWTFDTNNMILRHTLEGPPDLVASYLLGNVPAY